jgi:hypothetical protein
VELEELSDEEEGKDEYLRGDAGEAHPDREASSRPTRAASEDDVLIGTGALAGGETALTVARDDLLDSLQVAEGSLGRVEGGRRRVRWSASSSLT